jgi:carboxyl-terminal processing protease
MNRRLVYAFVVAVLGVNLVVGARLYSSSAADAEKDSPYPSLELFSYVMERVRKDYVDGQNLTYQQLVYGALKGMLNTLDPHSEFMEPEKFRDLQDDTQGAFGGLGVVISMREGFVTVVSPMDESPGFKAGILSGDRIVKIDGRSTERMDADDAKKYLRGEPGTMVKLTVFRPESNEYKEFELKREEIHVDMVKDINGKKEFPLSENKIGYVRLVQFGERTGEELTRAIKKLKAQDMRGFILDLRWNPGGLLEQAVDVCEHFLPRGQLVVTTEGRNPAQDSRRVAAGRGDMIEGVPMVILVNLGSASASEIVAGCLQDLKRAIILGEKTFGKGSVQSILPLSNGAALRLTTAKYYTPSHKVIHEEGITPDIYEPLSENQERLVLYQRAPGGLESLTPAERQEVMSVRDAQLDRAMDLLQGITLYTERSAPASGKEKRLASKQTNRP